MLIGEINKKKNENGFIITVQNRIIQHYSIEKLKKFFLRKKGFKRFFV